MMVETRARGLSVEHQGLLQLSRRISLAETCGTVTRELVREVKEAFQREVAPHLDAEDRELVPALRAIGEEQLADRVVAQHQQLRGALAVLNEGEPTTLSSFAADLAAHLGFEETEVLPLARRRLPEVVLRLEHPAPRD